ncbi:hypothetical protein QO011_007400 [Labrys wisconsinensis]|uniref:Uncharacterized protein n=1 Tax=Labrys wisconsinensis TaxID=425677 RepID=A0ABU0JL76_9HYPH|nr:hypothetical protein [Labrys wisconsinensis]
MGAAISILAGVFAGVALIAAAAWLSIAWERRSRLRKRSWLAPPSGNVDTGPSVGGG